MTELLAVVTITIFAVISPGPDFAIVSRNSLLTKRQTGVLTAIGIALGVFVHVGYTLLGVGILIRQSPVLLEVLRFAGALYLVWLGLTLILSRGKRADSGQSERGMSAMEALRMGFLTNALNPKTSVFIISLFLQVVSPATPLAIQIAYGLFISLTHGIWFSLVAVFFSAKTMQRIFEAARHLIDRVFGTILVGFGAALVVTGLGA
ncbi:LysE family transporter [uncultured Roseibium sp.]|uniref:LysE family translocator n=1 Tax=uncultured Roseibium sp. TaxID=1936171 RepID=UPI00262B2712|nr:LysE family transporter [uncultured Roseibium sp.]